MKEGIELEEWDRYFKGLLEGVEWRVRRGREMGEDGKEELKIEEIREVIKRLKDGKAIGGDGVPNEVWKYKGGELENWLGEICKKVWSRKGWPRDWSEGIIIPVEGRRKKGRRIQGYNVVTNSL